MSSILNGWFSLPDTWTPITEAYTNDPTAGSDKVLNVADTYGFYNGQRVTVSSSAGSEAATITAHVDNTSITVDVLALNHTTTDPLISGHGSFVNTNTTYAGCFVITGNRTAQYAVGRKVRFTQGGSTIYGVIIAVALEGDGGADTVITVFTGTTSVNSGAVTNPYMSLEAAPDGFPRTPSSWYVSTVETATRTAGGVNKLPTWYTPTSCPSIIVPIGNWHMRYNGSGTFVTAVATTYIAGYCGLATASSTAPADTTWTSQIYVYGASANPQALLHTFEKTNFLELAAATKYYPVVAGTTNAAAFSTLELPNINIGMRITAVCPYV